MGNVYNNIPCTVFPSFDTWTVFDKRGRLATPLTQACLVNMHDIGKELQGRYLAPPMLALPATKCNVRMKGRLVGGDQDATIVDAQIEVAQ